MLDPTRDSFNQLKIKFVINVGLIYYDGQMTVFMQQLPLFKQLISH